MEEKMVVEIYCTHCDFKTYREIEKNMYGYFEFPDAYCPNDFMLLVCEIKKERFGLVLVVVEEIQVDFVDKPVK